MATKAKVPGAGPTPDDGPRTPPRAVAPVKVRALREGYYEHLRRFPGDVFEIRGDTYPEDVVRTFRDRGETRTVVRHQRGELIDFSTEWMVRVDDPHVPLNQRGAQEILREEHDSILRDRVTTTTGGQNPLG